MPVSSSIGQDLLNVPMGDMIREMAFAIAEAQIKLDENSIEVAEMMGGLNTVTDDAGNVIFEDSRVFFGTEEVDLNEAAAQFNAGDLGFRQALRNAMPQALFDFADPTEDPVVTYTTLNDPGITNEILGNIVATPKSGQTGAVTIPVRLSMLELGFTPTFYQFVDTIIEVRIAISYTRESESQVEVNSTNKLVTKTKALRRTRRRLGRKSKNRTVTTNQVNATYSSKYSYTAEGSSLLRTKLAPIPAPPALEERVRVQLEKANATEQLPVAPDPS